MKRKLISGFTRKLFLKQVMTSGEMSEWLNKLVI